MTTAQRHNAPNRATSSSPVGGLTMSALVCLLASGCYGDLPDRPVVADEADTVAVEETRSIIELRDDVTTGPEPDALQAKEDAGTPDAGPIGVLECEDPALKAESLDLLDSYCAGCHTPGQGPSTGLAPDILDTATLIDNQVIIPGSATDSKMMKRINKSAGDPLVMPPSGHAPPTEAEVALLSQWIDCMVPKEVPTTYSTAQLYSWIEQRLDEEVPLLDQRQKRYISLVHLYNAGKSEQELQMFRDGVVKLVNSLSWRSTPYVPEFLGEQDLVIEIDLDELDWEEPKLPVGQEDVDVWERIEARYPYAVFDDTNDVEWVFSRTEAKKTPVIKGDWFAANASVPPLYHEVLGIPDNLSDMEDILGIDIADNVDNAPESNVMRAGVSFSKVSVNNRVVERHELGFNISGGVIPAYDGAFWLSYDFAGEQGLQNIIQHPTDFVHDGNEVIFNLPNGFQAYMITEAGGQRLDKAPTNIVSDNFTDATANIGPEVTNGLSCMSCHYAGIQPAEDIVLDIVTSYGSQAYPGEVKTLVGDLYVPQDIFDDAQVYDSQWFNDRLAQADLPEALDRHDEPTSQLAYEHLEPMDLTEVAAAVGLSVEEFQTDERLPLLKKARAQIGNLSENGGLIKRAVFDESFRDITCFLGQGEPVSSEETGGLPVSGCAIARLCNKGSGLDGLVRLTLDGVELEALPGKCSPCRSLPVGENLVAELVVETVVQQVDPTTGELVTVVEKTNLADETLTLDNEDEFLLDLQAVIDGNEIVDIDLVAAEIDGPLICDDVTSISQVE